MAFNVSYRALNEQNIRHIYSDQKIRFVFRKTTAFKPLKEELPIPPLRLYPKRFYDYYPAYQIGIPRAPAFRSTDNEHVERIVRRICKPIECQTERRKDLHGKGGQRKEGEGMDGEDGKRGDAIEEEEGDQEEDEAEVVDTEGGQSSSRGSKMSPREVKMMLARLQKPTQSWEKKKYNPEDRKLKEKESSIPKLPPIPPRY